ncbi:MAG: hypothetical protein ACRECT_03695 [Thermoplasmata archaeon]
MTRTIRLALATFIIGFLVEAAVELYQFLSYGLNRPGWPGFYYIGLVTTGVGFYLMYRGQHEWTALHQRNVHRGHRFLRASIAIFVGAVLAIAVLGATEGNPAGAGPAPGLAWLVGGLVALAFGNFFLGLAMLVDQLVGPYGRVLAWTGFAWSLGVAVLTGFLVGGEFPTLLHEFFTNPLGLIVSFAPLAFVIAPLFVSYGLFAAAYTDAFRRLRAPGAPGSTPPETRPDGPTPPPPAQRAEVVKSASIIAPITTR